MNRIVGNTLRIAAATAAVGAPAATASAETMPTQAKVRHVLQHDYRALTSRAESFGLKQGVDPSAIGKVGLTRSRTIFSGSKTGSVTEIQSDAYDKATRTLEEYVIDVYRPDSQKGNKATSNSLFQITLFKGKNKRAQAPRTPDGFSQAIDQAAGKSGSDEYHFGLGVQEDGSWKVSAWHSGDPQSEVLTTAMTGTSTSPETSATANFDAVKGLVAQAGRVLSAATHQRALPEGAPTDLFPKHPR